MRQKIKDRMRALKMEIREHKSFFYSVCDPSRTCDPCDDSSDIQSKL